MVSSTSETFLVVWQIASGLLNLALLAIWIYGFMVSLRVMKWYSAAGGFLAFGTGLSGLTIFVSGIIQVAFLLVSDYRMFSGSDMNYFILMTQGLGSLVGGVGVVSLMTGLTMLANRCRDLQRAD